MHRILRAAGVIWLIALLCQLTVTTQTGITSANFVNFEGAQTNPIRLSSDGTLLFAVNTPDARLSVFDLTAPSTPHLVAEIAVGIEPVSVNPRTNDEAWVVNQVSDSISVVSVGSGIVIDTLRVGDEPADVVFAGPGGKFAFVSVSRSNEVRVFDAELRTQLARIPLEGENPRALAVSPDGTRVYVAFALSGNKTTIIPTDAAPSQPAPSDTQLAAAPRVGLIVHAEDPAWAPGTIQYKMPDNDVAEIDATTLSVSRYFSGVGTINLGVAVSPTSGDVFVTNTDARNLVRFEPALRGRIVDNRVTRISAASGAAAPVDLNAGIDYAVLPNDAAKGSALAQPTAIVADGAAFYVAAFGTDRVAKIAEDGSVIARIDVGGGVSSARTMRGPRGLALNAGARVLYVLNRVSNTISVVDAAADAVLAEIPVGSFDPTPAVIRQGRGFLYDARLSGNGTAACAACHVDADMDLLAWDLGNPNGVMQRVSGQDMHPMKGPMTTQTLRGLRTLEPFHWRGDKATFLEFNPAFASLLGGSVLPDADMVAYRDFVETLKFQPNPNRNLDGSFLSSVAGGNPAAGQNTFVNDPFTANITCNTCHTAATEGTNRTIFAAATIQETQPFKVPHLRNLYQKTGMNKTAGARSVGGFGYLHDGSVGSLFEFLSLPVFQNLSTDAVKKRNVEAFLLSFDTGTPPAVGYSRTLTAVSLNALTVDTDWSTLEKVAAASDIDLIVKGTIDGEARGLLYRPTTNDYRTDRTGVGPFTRAQLREKIALGDTLTIMGVPPGSGTRMGVDRDVDGILDGDVGQPLPPPPSVTIHVADVATTTASGVVDSAFRRRDTVFWRVRVVDQNGDPVANASVLTNVTLGTTRVATVNATTGSDGVARFSRSAQTDAPGTYRISVTAVSAPDATFDAAANVESSTTYTLKR